MADNQDVNVTATENLVPAATEVFQNEVESVAYSADDLAKAREQEKAKLYPQMEKMKEELATLKKAREEELAKEAERANARAAKKAEEAAKAKQKEEEELSVKELLTKKEQEWQSQLEAERLERERAFAMLEKEREFQELNNYRQSRLEQERDSIVPELIDLISGNTKDEIEQSITMLKEKSASISSSVQQAMQTAKQQMAGTRITSPAAGPLDNDSSQQSLTPDSIRDLSMAEYAKQRAKLLGTAASNRGQGLFDR
jgi:DNA repair exonuclease SbcCD ATPase subunit